MKYFFLLLIIILMDPFWSGAQVTLVNKKGTLLSLDSSKWTLSGIHIFNKNTGNVGLGNPSPIYKLDVMGKVRISDSLLSNTARIATLNSGNNNDSLVVADPTTGILKRVSVQRTLSALDTATMLLPYLRKADTTAMLANYLVSANNGLTKSSKNIELGGALTKPTTITTTGTNTISIAGLQSGDQNDSIVVADPTSGELKRVEQRKKPELIKTTTTQVNSTITATTISTLTFNTIANKNYRVRLWLVYNSAATTTGIRLGPNAFLGGNYWYQVMVPSSTTANQYFSGFNTGTMLVSTASRATTGNVAFLEMDIEATSVATVSFQFASEVAGSAITIQANSRLEYEITN